MLWSWQKQNQRLCTSKSDIERWWSKPFDSYLHEGEEGQRENCRKTLGD